MRHGAYAAVACLLILLGGLSAAASPVPSGPSVAFVTIAKGTTSRLHEAVQLVVRDRESWTRVWARIVTPGNPPPAVDFGRDMVIALSPGPQSGSAIVTITRITRSPDHLVVWCMVRQKGPLPEGGGDGVSAPFHIVRLARSPLPVEFVFVKTPPLLRGAPWGSKSV